MDGAEPLTGLSADQQANVLCMAAAYPLALALDPCARGLHALTGLSTPTARHVTAIVGGAVLGTLALGPTGMAALIAPLCVAYLLLRTMPAPWVHIAVFVWSIGYLAGAHIYRMITDPYGWTLDYTGPLMIATVKVTSMAFSYHDGSAKPWAKAVPGVTSSSFQAVLDTWRELALDAPPSPLEFAAYMLYFPALLAGPMFDMQAYLALAETGPGPLAPRISSAASKAGLAVACVAVFTWLGAIAPDAYYFDNEFVDGRSAVFRMAYIYLAQTGLRARYYFAFAFSEGACHAAGLVSLANVDILRIETAQNFKVAVENWNIGVARWLKLYVYHRVTPLDAFVRGGSGSFVNVLATNVMGAIWHGFYPGYYVSFILGSFCTQFARTVRRKIRPHAVKAGTAVKVVYDAVGWMGSAAILAFGSVPFTRLRLDETLQVWGSVGFFVPILVFGGLAVLAFVPSPPRPSNKSKAR